MAKFLNEACLTCGAPTAAAALQICRALHLARACCFRNRPTRGCGVSASTTIVQFLRTADRRMMVASNSSPRWKCQTQLRLAGSGQSRESAPKGY